MHYMSAQVFIPYLLSTLVRMSLFSLRGGNAFYYIHRLKDNISL